VISFGLTFYGKREKLEAIQYISIVSDLTDLNEFEERFVRGGLFTAQYARLRENGASTTD